MRAYLWFLAAGCTGSIGGGDDQPPPPPPTDVQIVVQDGATLQSGVRVVFQNADGSTLVEKMTDGSGFAAMEMPDGGNLTVIRTYPPVPPPGEPRPPDVYTYVGVKPGDRLALGHETDLSGTPAAINVAVPTAAQGPVDIVTPCGSGQGNPPNVAITVVGCPAQMAVYITDQNQSSVFAQMPYAPSLDLSGQTLVGTLSTTLSANGLSPGDAVTLEVRLMSGTFELYTSNPQRVDGGPQTVDLPNLQGLDELVVATIAPQAGGAQMVASRKPYTPSPTSFDASVGLIPYVTGTPMFTPAAITWTESGPGTADAVIVSLEVTRSGAPPGAVGYARYIIAPHAGTSLTIPQLAGADAIYNPQMMDQINGAYGIAQMAGGYDAMRSHAFAVSSLIEAASTSGSVVLSYAGNAPPGL